MFKRIFSILLSVIIVISMAACSNEDNAVYDDYSYGLDANGFYENLSDYEITLPDLSKLKLQVDDMLKYGLSLNSESTNAPKTVDEYLKSYTNELLSALGMATKKEPIVDGDIVTAKLRFIVDGTELPEYANTNKYEANADGDSIVSSFIGKKYGDLYEVEYTFPDDDEYYPSKVATVNITIDDVYLDDALNKGVVEENAETLSLYVGAEITDANSLMTALKPMLASVLISSYLETYLNNLDIDVPKKLVDCEVYRLKARLQQIGYTYSKYLEDAVLTDKDVREYCTSIAKSNLILMLFAKQEGIEITDEQIKSYYGDNFEYVHEMQGSPYMKLNLLRDTTLYYLSSMVTLMDGEDVVNTDDLFPDVDIPGVGGTDNDTDSTDITESTDVTTDNNTTSVDNCASDEQLDSESAIPTDSTDITESATRE